MSEDKDGGDTDVIVNQGKGEDKGEGGVRVLSMVNEGESKVVATPAES